MGQPGLMGQLVRALRPVVPPPPPPIHPVTPPFSEALTWLFSGPEKEEDEKVFNFSSIKKIV